VILCLPKWIAPWSFSRWTVLFAALFVYFMSPKANCAIYSAQLLYVSASRGGLPYFGEFFPVNRVIYSSLCAFMPPKVNCAIYSAQLVYVCACIWSGQMPNFGKFFPVNPVIYSSLCAFLHPKVNCAIYSAWLVYASACIWSRVKCPILVSFSRWILLFPRASERRVLPIVGGL